MATELDSGGGSKRRRPDEDGEQAQQDVEKAQKERISTLPEDLRLDILALLPLKSAIRTGVLSTKWRSRDALSTQWRPLWTRRWPDASLEFRVPDQHSPQVMQNLEKRRGGRLDRFSLTFEVSELGTEDLYRCLDYAAACAVADLGVHLLMSCKVLDYTLRFAVPPGNPHLERLSLSGDLICSFPHDSHPYSVLEAIHLQRVRFYDNTTFFNLVAACPLLCTLDVRYCRDLPSADLSAAANPKTVTVVECLDNIYIDETSGLRSFRFSGYYIPAYQIPTNPTIVDLYLCFWGHAHRRLGTRTTIYGTPIYDDYRRPCKLRRSYLDAVKSISNLTVLTLSSGVLRRVSGKARAKSTAGNAALCKLQNLRELQLVMFAMCNENLDDIMDFLMICCSSRLERLFVQLPLSDEYKPDDEPSESEEDVSEEEVSEEAELEEQRSWRHASEEDELEKELSEGEESDEDQSEQDELEGVESGEKHLKVDAAEEEVSEEDELEEELFQGEESDEDQSEQDELEEVESWGNHSKVDASEEEVSEEYHSKEDESEEQGSAEGQSKKDGSEKELSDGGQSAEEPLGDGCEKPYVAQDGEF